MPDGHTVQIESSRELAVALRRLSPADANYAAQFVDRMLTAACARPISDLHLTPTCEGLRLLWRSAGVLEEIGVFPPGEKADIVTRLKVLAELLTYRQETPQEGRLRVPHAGLEMRISTFPTLYGERAAIRIFRSSSGLELLADLHLPADLLPALAVKLQHTSGGIIITGPAGSGKTTTAYACLRELLRNEVPRSILTLEDPIESALPGTAQAAMQPSTGFDFAAALRSVMRQDPEVILVGEVRDRETAMAAFQAALTGHLVFTTFHAGNTATAVSRLIDMGIEPYLLRSGIQALLGQRLVRRLCECAVSVENHELALGLRVNHFRIPQSCSRCGFTGYLGRIVLAEMLPPLIDQLGSLILSRADAPRLQQAATELGMVTLWERALATVEAGFTSPAEVRRVLGFGDSQERPVV